MAPKTKVEVVAAPDPSETLPTLENEITVEELLSKAKIRDLAAVESLTAIALGCASEYKVVLRSSILVDFAVEAILFASQHNYSAKKTIMFIRWLNDMRKAIELTGDVKEAKVMMKEQLVSHAEKAAKDASSSSAAGLQGGGAGGVAGGGSGDVAGEGNPTGGEGGNPSGASAASAAATVKAAPAPKPSAKESKGGKGAKSDTNADAAATRVEAPILFSIQDMGYVADYVTTGLLQHWRLWHLCSRDAVHWSAPTIFTVNVQLPMRPPPLVRALTQEQHDVQQEEVRSKAELELTKLRQSEHEAAEIERLETERKLAEEKLAKEEQEAATLYFAKKGTHEAVNHVHKDVESQLGGRQQALLVRIAKLEELLKV